MKLVDANVLLYAVNDDSPQHAASHRWLTASLAGEDRVGFTWTVLTAFVRIATNPRIFARSLAVAEAVDQLEEWTEAATSVVVEPRVGHLRLLRELLEPNGTAGNLTGDAHLAAIAIEHRAEIVSWDSDFSRFAGVRWRRPSDLVT